MHPSALFLHPLPLPLPRHTPPTTRNRSSLRPPHSCTAAPSPPDIDRLFSRLGHVNKNLRRKASYQLAECATPQIISRLISLLSVQDVAHRRAAVQALAMTGLSVLHPVLHLMDTTDNPTARASCAKVLAGIALFFPEQRQHFPEHALNSVQQALQIADPVTKLATVGCLSTLGSDLKEQGNLVAIGNSRAVQILFSLCTPSADMAVSATAVGALAQIAQNGTPETKQNVIHHLQNLTASDDDDDQPGFNYIREMASSHLEQLQGQSVLADPE